VILDTQGDADGAGLAAGLIASAGQGHTGAGPPVITLYRDSKPASPGPPTVLMPNCALRASVPAPG